MRRNPPGVQVVAVLFLLVLSSGLAQAGPMKLEHLSRIQSVAEIAVSLEGKRIAYTLNVQRDPFSTEADGAAHRHLYLTEDGETRAFVTGPFQVKQISWRPDGKAIGFLAKRGDDEFVSLYEIPAGGGEARLLHGHGADIQDFEWLADNEVVFLAAEPQNAREKKLEEAGFTAKVFEEDLDYVRAWRFSLDDDEAERLPLDGSGSAIAVSPERDRIAVKAAPTPLVDDALVNSRLHLMDPDGGNAAVVETPGKLGGFAFSPDGARIAFNAGNDRNDPGSGVLMVADAGDGSFSALTPEAPFHVRDQAWLGADRILAVVHRREASELVVFSSDGERRGEFPTGDLIVQSVNASNGRAALGADAPSHPRALYRLDTERGPQRVTRHNDWLDEVDLAKQRVYTFDARDGLEISGVLFEPLNGAESAPLWVMPHGGPESHRSNGWLTRYSTPAQVAAGQGYAVYFPNYRGSTGRGIAFSKRHQKDYAGGEFEDIVDGVKALVEDGIADADRVGISGGSYGGYASAWAATAQSGHFAAAVTYAGISNQTSKFGTTDIPQEMYLVHSRQWPWEDWDYMRERSPVGQAGESATPTLIAHGEADTRVHPAQSLELYRHLKLRSEAPVRLVTYPGEPHGNEKAAARYDYATRLMRWMNHYVTGEGGDPPPFELDIADRLPEDKKPVEE